MGAGSFSQCMISKVGSNLFRGAIIGKLDGKTAIAQAAIQCGLAQMKKGEVPGKGREMKSTQGEGRFKRSFDKDKIPTITRVDGSQIRGELGAVVTRSKGDFKQINARLINQRLDVAESRKNITSTASGLSGNKKTEYLDQQWQGIEADLIFLRQQYDVYPKNSIQSRMIDNRIKGQVNLINHVETLAGVRKSTRDYYSVPKMDGRKKIRDFGDSLLDIVYKPAKD